jgi:hypothetical protein
VSFFDEGDEPRTTRRARPRPQGRGSQRTAPRPPDRQTLLIRQVVAGVVVLLVLILLVVGIN